MSIERRFSKGVAWMAAGNWIEQAINFAVFVLLARLLGPEIFGLAAMAAVGVILAEFLVRESVSEFLISSEDPDDAHFQAAFWLLAALGGVLFVLLWLCSGPIAAFYGRPDVAPVIVWFAPTVVLIALTAVPVAILRRDMAFRVLSLRAIAGVVAGGVVGVAMALMGYGVWALVGQRLAQVGANIVLAWAAVAWRPRFALSVTAAREVMSMGGKVVGLRTAELVSTQTPSVVVGALLGPVALGQFTIAWRLVEIASFLIVTPLRMAAQPAFAAVRRGGGDPGAMLRDIGRLSSLVAFPAFAGMAAVAAPLIAVVFGPGWPEAQPVLAALAAVGLYFCIEKVQQAFCLAAGRAGALTALAWVEAALGVLVVWIASGYGLVAVALAFGARYYLLWPARFAIVGRISGLSIGALLAPFWWPLVLSLCMAAVVVGVIAVTADAPAVIQLGFGMGAGALVYGAATVLTMRARIVLLRRYLGR